MKDIWLDYLWTDEEGAPLTLTEREYFKSEDALYRRREELEEQYALIIGVHIPEKPELPIDKPLIF